MRSLSVLTQEGAVQKTLGLYAYFLNPASRTELNYYCLSITVFLCKLPLILVVFHVHFNAALKAYIPGAHVTCHCSSAAHLHC